MNIHPVLVHFPIALFTIYAALEVFNFFVKKYNMDIAKGILVTIGTVMAFLTLPTGETAEHLVTEGDNTLRPLIEKHSAYATLSTYIFLSLALVYLFKYIKTTNLWMNPKIPEFVKKFVEFYLKYLDCKWFLGIVSILGLIAITITGALGGAIVYGPNIDPFVTFFYNLFF